jgi:uncharacterized iron-regulated membrane protein
MSQFEHDLRESLRHRPAPPGFAERVLERTRRSEVGRPLFPRWLAIAALLVVMIGSGALVWEQRRQREGEKAKEQLMVALQITGSKLRSVQARLATIQQRAVQPQPDK